MGQRANHLEPELYDSGYSGKFGLNIWMTLGGCLNWCFTCFGMQAPDLLLHSFISEDRSIKWNNHGVSRQGLHNLAEAAYPCSRSWISDERCTCLLPVTPQVASTQVCERQVQWRFWVSARRFSPCHHRAVLRVYTHWLHMTVAARFHFTRNRRGTRRARGGSGRRQGVEQRLKLSVALCSAGSPWPQISVLGKLMRNHGFYPSGPSGRRL